MKKLTLPVFLIFFVIAFEAMAATIPALDISRETDHIKIYCTQQDASCIDNVTQAIEAKYSKISSDLAFSLTTKIQINVYPDLDTYHAALGDPDLPDWVVGDTEFSGIINMVSPLNPGPTHDYQGMLSVAVHEVTHAFALTINPHIPRWLNEGLAAFEAGQMDENRRNYIIQKVKNNQFPKFEGFNTNSIQFGNIGGYQWCYTIIEFAVNTFGIEKLPKWVRSGGNFQSTFGISEEAFRAQWMDYLKAIYKVDPTTREIKKIRIINVYWSTDEQLKGIIAKRPHSLLLKTDLPTNHIQTKPIINFLYNAGYQFKLTAEGKNKITATVYEGKVFNMNQNSFFGFWILFSEEEFNKLEHGVIYKLTPQNDTNEYQWLVDENLTIKIP